MANENTNRKWIACQLDEERFNAFWRLASEMGLHPSIVLERAALEYIRTMGKSSKVADVYIAAQLLEVEARTSRINNAKRMAYAHLEDPTDESADQLKIVCEMAGIVMETVIDDITNSHQIRELVSQNGTLSDVEIWLLKKMEAGKTYPYDDIVKEAKEAGHSAYQMKEVKKRLGIISKRMGNHWVWLLAHKRDATDDLSVLPQ